MLATTAYREIRRQYPDVPAHVAMSWARTRVEILDYVAAEHDEWGEYAMSVQLPGRPALVYVYSEPDDDDCGWGDGCDEHPHVVLFARIPERTGRTVVAAVGCVCDGIGDGVGSDYEYHAGLALELAREGHATCDEWDRTGLR